MDLTADEYTVVMLAKLVDLMVLHEQGAIASDKAARELGEIQRSLADTDVIRRCRAVPVARSWSRA